VPPPAVGRSMLKFPDDTQVSVIGLNDIMVELCRMIYSKMHRLLCSTKKKAERMDEPCLLRQLAGAC